MFLENIIISISMYWLLMYSCTYLGIYLILIKILTDESQLFRIWLYVHSFSNGRPIRDFSSLIGWLLENWKLLSAHPKSEELLVLICQNLFENYINCWLNLRILVKWAAMNNLLHFQHNAQGKMLYKATLQSHLWLIGRKLKIFSYHTN